MSTPYLSSFALLASFNPEGDTSLPSTAAVVGVPTPTTAGTPITVIWSTSNVVQVQITANNGIDPPIDSGKINTTGSGTYNISSGVTVTTTFTFNAYNPVNVLAVTQTFQIVIS